MKRYLAYKDSGIEWIGKLPDHWTSKRFKFAISCLESGHRETGGGSQRSDGVFSVGGEHVGWLGEIFSEGKKYISEDYYAAMTKGRIKEEDVLLVKDGATIGKCAFVREIPDGKAAVNEHVFLMRANKKYDGRYIFYFIWSYVGQEQINLQVRGSAQPGLNSLFQNYLLIPDLPLEEQRTISSYLEYKAHQIDALIAKKERMIELLMEERAAVINQAVTKGLDPNVEVQDSGIEWLGRVPKSWQIKRLKYVGKVIIGLTYAPEETSPTGTLVLRSSNIQDGKIVFDDTVYVNKQIPDKLLVKDGDILICSRNGSRSLIGKCAQINDKHKGNTFGAFMTIFRGQSNRFVYYVFNSTIFAFHVGSFLTATINQLTTENLNGIIIALPSKEEQLAIAEFLDAKTTQIDAQVDRARKSVELLKEYRTALISDVVTGKIDVRKN